MRRYDHLCQPNMPISLELAISAWEAVPSWLLHGLSCKEACLSDRERPLVTGVNGPLMARRTAVRPALMAVPWSSLVLLDSCHPSGRGRRVKAREATACGLALTRRHSAETIEQRAALEVARCTALETPAAVEHRCIRSRLHGFVLGPGCPAQAHQGYRTYRRVGCRGVGVAGDPDTNHQSCQVDVSEGDEHRDGDGSRIWGGLSISPGFQIFLAALASSGGIWLDSLSWAKGEITGGIGGQVVVSLAGTCLLVIPGLLVIYPRGTASAAAMGSCHGAVPDAAARNG